MGFQTMYEDLKDHFLTAAGRDPRTRDLPICNSYPMVLMIIVAYVLLVKKIGPAFMARRKPYNIKKLIIAYNFLQVVLNVAIFIEATRHYIFNPKYSWSCMAHDMTDFSYHSVQLKWCAYAYFLNKIMDCLDTVFFVMRKKFNHVSLLHVYHHATMVWGSFLYCNLLFASQFSVIGYVNGAVHALMYTYYLVASLNLNIDLSVWKRRLTRFQLMQFVYFIIKLMVPLMNNRCGLPKIWLVVMIAENVIMIALFSNFYYKNYIAKKSPLKGSVKEN